MEELVLGIRENMIKNIYTARVDGGARGEIDFGRMYEVLHTVDVNGVPQMAHINQYKQ